MNKEQRTCDYFECDEPLAPNQPKTGMKFCQVHEDEFNKLVENEDIPGMLRFHVRSLGGARRAAGVRE